MTTTNMPLWVWAITLVVIGGLLAFDFFFHVRKAHEPSLKEAAWWSAFYVGVAVVFGIVLWSIGDHHLGIEYFSGYLLEKALSVDNLFVFMLLLSSFAVPKELQQRVLLIGVAGAAALRLMVYCKGKNAKKYRKGVEYGSARWSA